MIAFSHHRVRKGAVYGDWHCVRTFDPSFDPEVTRIIPEGEYWGQTHQRLWETRVSKHQVHVSGNVILWLVWAPHLDNDPWNIIPGSYELRLNLRQTAAPCIRLEGHEDNFVFLTSHPYMKYFGILGTREVLRKCLKLFWYHKLIRKVKNAQKLEFWRIKVSW